MRIQGGGIARSRLALGKNFNNNRITFKIIMQTDTNSTTIFAGFLGCYTCCALPLIVTAFIYGLQDMPECASEYLGISFQYNTWLVVKAATDIGMIGLLWLLLWVAAYVDASVGACLAFCAYVLYGLFDFAWYVVGAILLFNTLAGSECSTSPYWAFGIAMFVIQSCAVLSRLFTNPSQ